MAEDLRDKIRATLAEQRKLVARLLRLRDQLAGSLFVRYGTCGKASCACRTGRRHGPYYVLSTRSGGQGGFAYVDEGTAGKARERVARYREFRAGLVALQKVNARVVAQLRKYQKGQLRETARRLRLPAAEKNP
jgi:uncharacterized protein DUF6788